MAQFLTGNTVASTYKALIKVGDNDQLDANLKVLSDGFGTELPVEVSTTTFKVTGVLNTIDGTIVVSSPITNDEAANKGYVDQEVGDEETARINADAALQSDIDDNAGAIQVIQLWTISDGTTELQLSDSIQFTGTNGITVTANDSNNTITIDGSGVAGDVSSVNSLTGALTIEGAGGITVTDDGTDTITVDGQALFTAINSEATARANADTTLQNAIDDLEAGTGNVISVNSLTGAITLSPGNNITFDVVGNDIEINAAGTGGAAVDSVNSLTGAIDIVSTDLDLLTVSTNGQDIELNPILPRTMLEDVKNVSGGDLTKGMALHITGSTGNEAEVIAADAASGLAAHLVLNEDLPNNLDSGKAVAVGFINNVSVPDTTNFQPGTEVYLGNSGAFTHIKPTGTSIVQYLGVVLNASTTSGAGTISGIIQNLGVENQLPNLPENHLWQGDSNGVPVATDRDSILVGFATLASNVDLQNTSSGDYGLVLHQGGGAGDGQLYADSDGNVPTWNATANLLTMANANVTANLQIGAITDVEQAIDDVESDVSTLQSDVTTLQGDVSSLQTDVNQNTTDIGTNASDIAALQAIPQVAPVVQGLSFDIVIGNTTYDNKFLVFSLNSTIEMDSIQGGYEPALGTEIYFMSTTGQLEIDPTVVTMLTPNGKSLLSRGANSVIGIKCIDEGDPQGAEPTWVVFGDLADS